MTFPEAYTGFRGKYSTEQSSGGRSSQRSILAVIKPELEVHIPKQFLRMHSIAGTLQPIQVKRPAVFAKREDVAGMYAWLLLDYIFIEKFKDPSGNIVIS